MKAGVLLPLLILLLQLLIRVGVCQDDVHQSSSSSSSSSSSPSSSSSSKALDVHASSSSSSSEALDVHAWLLRHQRRVYSQNGEDGFLEALLALVEEVQGGDGYGQPQPQQQPQQQQQPSASTAALGSGTSSGPPDTAARLTLAQRWDIVKKELGLDMGIGVSAAAVSRALEVVGLGAQAYGLNLKERVDLLVEQVNG